MSIWFDFLNKYYLEPIRVDGGYNFVNSITYAIIALVLLLAIYKCLQKFNIEINFKFFISLLPFVVLGSSLRAFVDHNLFKYGFWLSAPGIYILIAGIFLASFAISVLIQKFTNKEYWKTSATIGLILLIITYGSLFKKIHLQNLFYGFAIVGLAILISIMLYFIFKKVKKINFMSENLNFMPFTAHLLDASATFVAVDFLGFSEKHPLPLIVSGLANTAAAMFFLKLIVLIPAVYYLNKDIENKNLRNFLLVAITILGLAEGLRDLLTVLLI